MTEPSVEKDITVLIIDDEEFVLSSIKRLFMNEPFTVVTTTDPKVVFDILSKEKIKVMVSDQRMPLITGVEILKEVKEKYPDIIRILFTGHADLQVAEEAINIAGVYRFINKPWNNEEFKEAIRHAVRHFDLIIENRNLLEATKTQNNELERLNRKLKAMYETQKEFSSTVSHELRTPLSSIKTAIDIVMSETAGGLTEDQKNFLNKAKSNVDRLHRLINDILDLSKLESGRVVLKFEEHDLNEIIKTIAEMQTPVATRQKLYLETKLDPAMPKILLDLDKINQVLDNLLSNAIKFTESGGITIETEVREKSNIIQVSVKDTGAGIAAEDIPKLFQKFQQLGDPAKRKTGGTGLGLAICKEILTQHGGKIWVESQPGTGSRFCFLLPIQERRREVR